MTTRKLLFFSGNRAEYGFLKPLLARFSSEEGFSVSLVLSGNHVDQIFGNTANEILADGFESNLNIFSNRSNDGLEGTVGTINNIIKEFGRFIEYEKPDFVFIFADRLESFAAAIAASQLDQVILHFEGGDITEGGALDDIVRHAITKLANVHFATNDFSARRIIASGEEAWRVHNIGLPSLDLMKAVEAIDSKEIRARFGFDESRPIVLTTMHPIATNIEQTQREIGAVLAASESLGRDGYQFLFTGPNSDAGGLMIRSQIQEFVSGPARCFARFEDSLGVHLYQRVLASSGTYRIACAGNSSSGVKEAGFFHCPVVNIGRRQAGRPMGPNVISCDALSNDIEFAIRSAIEDEDFRCKCKSLQNPYGDGYAAERVVAILKKLPAVESLKMKKFTFDLEQKPEISLFALD